MQRHAAGPAPLAAPHGHAEARDIQVADLEVTHLLDAQAGIDQQRQRRLIPQPEPRILLLNDRAEQGIHRCGWDGTWASLLLGERLQSLERVLRHHPPSLRPDEEVFECARGAVDGARVLAVFDLPMALPGGGVACDDQRGVERPPLGRLPPACEAVQRAAVGLDGQRRGAGLSAGREVVGDGVMHRRWSPHLR